MSARCNAQVAVGERVLVEVDSVNSPTGLWEGVVTHCGEERGKYDESYEVRATLTDTRLPIEQRGREATANYRVWPMWTRTLFDRVEHWREQSIANAREARILRSVLPGEQMAAQLARIEAALTKGGGA